MDNMMAEVARKEEEAAKAKEAEEAAAKRAEDEAAAKANEAEEAAAKCAEDEAAAARAADAAKRTTDETALEEGMLADAKTKEAKEADAVKEAEEAVVTKDGEETIAAEETLAKEVVTLDKFMAMLQPDASSSVATVPPKKKPRHKIQIKTKPFKTNPIETLGKREPKNNMLLLGTPLTEEKKKEEKTKEKKEEKKEQKTFKRKR